jgi:hypothetical protein
VSFQNQGPQTPQEKAALIKNLTQTATVAGLSAGFDEDEKEEQAEVAALIIKWVGTVSPVLTEGATWEQVTEVFGSAFPTRDLPPEVVIAVQSSVSILNIYVRPPDLDLSEVLGSDRLLYLQAFLDGVSAGATPFLPQEE